MSEDVTSMKIEAPAMHSYHAMSISSPKAFYTNTEFEPTADSNERIPFQLHCPHYAHLFSPWIPTNVLLLF